MTISHLTFLKYQLLSNLFLKPISDILSNIFTWEDSRAQKKWPLGWCRLRWRRIVPAQNDDDDFDDDNGDEENDDDDFDDDNEDNDDGVCKRLNSNKIIIENHYWPVAIWLNYWWILKTEKMKMLPSVLGGPLIYISQWWLTLSTWYSKWSKQNTFGGCIDLKQSILGKFINHHYIIPYTVLKTGNHNIKKMREKV